MLLVILIDASKRPVYFVKDRGEKCHVDELIDTLNECKDAADALGFSFYRVLKHDSYPAGCKKKILPGLNYAKFELLPHVEP